MTTDRDLADEPSEPESGMYPPGTKTFIGVCLVPDCNRPAHGLQQVAKCECSWTQVTCLMAHRTTVTVMLHQGKHSEELQGS